MALQPAPFSSFVGNASSTTLFTSFVGNASSTTLFSSFVGDASSTTAAVFMIGELSACVADRVRAFGASSQLDTHVLLDPKFAVDEGLVAALSSDGIYVASQPAAPASMLTFGDANHATGSSGNTKPSFLTWLLAQKRYAHAWHLEDDVFFSGAWHNLVRDPRLREDADLVAHLEDKGPWWSHWPLSSEAQYGECRLAAGRACRDYAPNATQTFWPLLRMSRAYAQRLAAAFDAGATGHHELLTGSLCLASPEWCSVQPLPPDRVGLFVLGGWVNETHNFDCALRGTMRAERLASSDVATRGEDFGDATGLPCADPLARRPEDAPPEWRCRLYHPNKCRLQNESGGLALAWAATASEGCPSEMSVPSH